MSSSFEALIFILKEPTPLFIGVLRFTVSVDLLRVSFKGVIYFFATLNIFLNLLRLSLII
jgi:hypothetical protein